MEALRQLVGRERNLRETAQTLYFCIRAEHVPAVGALHVTCSDETEHECLEALQQGFVRYLLPRLKFAHQAPFRIANLGGRYEWGAARIAEMHFAVEPTAAGSHKLLVAKINSHVSLEPRPGATPPFRLGTWRRYGVDSPCCGALSFLMAGSHEPFTEELRETLSSEGHDRVATLCDPERVAPPLAPLFAAIVSARLQARKLVLDVQDYEPRTPTVYVILACATINRDEPDTEILCGIYTVDTRGGRRDVVYYGLGDDPADYRVSIEHQRFRVVDDQLGGARQGRDHRAMALATMRERVDPGRLRVHDERLERVRQDVARNKHRHHHHARLLLSTALPVLAEIAPVPTAILVFAQGAAGIHHAFRVDRLARDMKGTEEARRILDEVHERIDQLDGDRAEALVELLVSEYRK